MNPLNRVTSASNSVIDRWKTRPRPARILSVVALLFAIQAAGTAWRFRDITGLWLALGFIVVAITLQVEEWEIKTFLFTGALALSRLCLQLAARLNGMPARAYDVADLATIGGHTSAEDPADPPVLITDLLSILDRSVGKSIVLEIPRYHIRATRVTPMDEFIEQHACREGRPMPEPEPWFAER